MRDDDNQDEYENKVSFGYYNPKDEQFIECACGWHGTIADCTQRNYSNNGFDRLSGRKGYHWHCPDCNAIVWHYYHTIS